MLKYQLTQEQVQQIEALNQPNLIFAPSWDCDFDCVCVSDRTFYLPEFAAHQALLESWNLEGIECEEDTQEFLL